MVVQYDWTSERARAALAVLRGPALVAPSLNRRDQPFLFSPYGAGSRRHLDERFSAPEVLKPIRSQLGVTHRVLDVLVPEPCLQRPRIVPGIGQGVATGVPQHVREDREGHAGALAEALE